MARQTDIPAFYSSVSVFILSGMLLSKVALIVLHVYDVYLLTPVIRELYTSQMYTDAYLLEAWMCQMCFHYCYCS